MSWEKTNYTEAGVQMLLDSIDGARLTSALAVSAGHCIAGPLDAHHRGATRCFRHFLYLPV